ncbi:MAG: TIR domain-containing protein [Lachnospiraceae bacterium]|nr:TIR domain-containing protein [Lachnospiraceae bacterium]
MNKQTLFISYCWKDGNTYADELETQLKDEFDVKRDKSQLIANDDMYDFMAGIANCDNVIIVLTSEYVKSLNCMLEMAYLVSQEDWASKSMVLVIDDSLYSLDRKIEVINYWLLRQKRILNESDEVGKSLYEEEQEYLDLICDKVEQFFKGVSRRKNPSQIAIVNEVIKKSKRNKQPEQELIGNGQTAVLNLIKENEGITMAELAEKSGRSRATIQRYVSNMIENGTIERDGTRKSGYFVFKK